LQDESRVTAAGLLAVIFRNSALRCFVAHFAPAGTRLLVLLRPSEPERVRIAVCGALCAAVERSSAAADVAPSVRRDVAGLLSKVIPLLLGNASLREPGSAAAEAALRVFHVVAAGSCASVLRAHAEAVETAAAAALVGAETSTWAGAVLSALPRVAGDAPAWSAFAQRVLLAAHAALDVALRGLEPQRAGTVSRGALDAPGEALPRALDPLAAEATATSGQRRASAWLDVAAGMLDTPFPTAVPFPTMSLYALVARVLAADGRPVAALSGAAAPPAAPAVLMALPELHGAALRLLRAALRAGRRAGMLQVASPTADLLRVALRSGVAAPLANSTAPSDAVPTCPKLRASLYAAVASYMQVMGSSFAASLGPELVVACTRDISVPRLTGHAAAPELGASRAGGKKRKQEEATLGELSTLPSTSAAGAGGARTSLAVDGTAGSAGAAVRIAALQALEVLCSVAGGVLAERARADLDAAVASAASMYVAVGSTDSRCTASAAERRAAYSCLLASVLAPRPRRAPHLPLALSLFRRGAGEPDMTAFCGRALLALEAVVHPVATPRAQPRDMAEPSRQGAAGDVQAQASTQVLTFSKPAAATPSASRLASALPTAAAERPVAQPWHAPARSAPVPFASEQRPPAPAPLATKPAIPASDPSSALPVLVTTAAAQPAAAPAVRSFHTAAAPAQERAAMPIPLHGPGAQARADAALSSDSEGPLPDLVFDA